MPEDSNFSNILDLLINCATFIYIGATMPFDDFENSMLTLKAWRLAVLGICVLLIRRLPAMLALYKFIPDIKTFREAIFAGFFGPMVSIIFGICACAAQLCTRMCADLACTYCRALELSSSLHWLCQNCLRRIYHLRQRTMS